MARAPVQHNIDRTMVRASLALEQMEYFRAERLSWQALCRAHEVADFDRMARITLPLLEARRQKRQLATDVAHANSGQVPIVDDAELARVTPPVAGCFLVQPPSIGADARVYKDLADAAEVPVFVLAREPMNRAGAWPVVAVGLLTLRARLAPPAPPRAPSPPWPARYMEDAVTRDDVRPQTHWVPLEWFEAAAEHLGDSAIAQLDDNEPAAWQADDLMWFLEAFPDHEKLHQRLEDACIRAQHEGVPAAGRHRPGSHDPFTN